MEVTEGPFTGLIGVVTKNSKGMHVHIIFKKFGIDIVLKNTRLLPLSKK